MLGYLINLVLFAANTIIMVVLIFVGTPLHDLPFKIEKMQQLGIELKEINMKKYSKFHYFMRYYSIFIIPFASIYAILMMWYFIYKHKGLIEWYEYEIERLR